MEYKIIPIFYIVRTYDSRGEEMDSSSQEESSESSIEEVSSSQEEQTSNMHDEDEEGWGPIHWF